ncbi:MAG: ABC transporter substrate binding protein [Rhodocyclaceae bacterium]|nr:ABC transporter substrate binding protein [Rhodocyclaceae bacterium]
MARFLSRLAIACLLVMTLVLPAAASQRVWVVVAEEGGVQAETAAVLQAGLDGLELKVSRRQLPLQDSEEPPALIVTVGAAAFDETLGWLAGRPGAWERVPVLATLLPRAAYDARAARHAPGIAGQRALSAAVLDQPLARQLALLKRALPDRPRVGVLAGPQTQPLLPALEKAATARGLRLVAAPVNAPDEIYPALKAVLESADVILALPEPTVYHSATLQNILLTTYRARVPLVAFSPAYVKAGAVLAVYATPTQVARRAIEMVRGWQAGRGLPPPQMSREFDVAVNTKVAASLGLSVDAGAAIAEDLRRQEGGP